MLAVGIGDAVDGGVDSFDLAGQPEAFAEGDLGDDGFGRPGAGERVGEQRHLFGVGVRLSLAAAGPGLEV
ncbi:MAG: hypothetical protein BWY63_03725 [Chloroflexi bacterium ADurb.Bin360]|nr:MAG: hypothetical protein BWY63_03725 [Chloroflexi bacterium ADurb.Bin360]